MCFITRNPVNTNHMFEEVNPSLVSCIAQRAVLARVGAIVSQWKTIPAKACLWLVDDL